MGCPKQEKFGFKHWAPQKHTQGRWIKEGRVKVMLLPLSDIDFRFSFHKLCFSCSFLLILNNEKISKKIWAMAAHQKLNSLISVFLITLINPFKKIIWVPK